MLQGFLNGKYLFYCKLWGWHDIQNHGGNMDWSIYLHLIVAVPAAVVLLALGTKVMPSLSAPSKRRTGWELLLLGGITLLGLFIIYSAFYMERLSFAYAIGDVGSDTIEQYVPFYCGLIGSAREGTLTFFNYWTFDFELGVNAATFQQWMYDPFNLIVISLGLLLGEAHLSLVLVITQSIKVVLSIFLFDHFLTRYCDTPIARVLGALLYGFSGFMILGAQHYWLGSVFPIFTFAMLMFELYLEKRDIARFLGVVIACTVLLAWSPYLSFMVLMFAAVYLLLRIPHALEKPTAASYFAMIAKLAAPVFIGVLIAGISLVPYANFLLGETVRTASETSLGQRVVEKATSFVPLDWIPAILSRLIGSGLINTGAATFTDTVSSVPDIGFEGSFPYEFILMGYSVGVLALLSQFYHWAFTELKRGAKIIIGIATALAALYCFHQLLPTVLTFMVRLQYRSCFVLSLPFCCAMALGFEKRVLPGSIAWKPLIGTGALTAAILVWSLVETITGRLVCLYYIAALIVGVVLLFLLFKLDRQDGRASHRALVVTMLVALLVSTSVIDGFFTTNSRHTVPRADFPLSGVDDRDADTLAALAYLEEHDDTFYRVDKTYSDWSPLNDSLIQHFPSVSAYNSSADGDVDRFYRQLWKEAVSTWAVYSQGFKNAPDSPEILQLLDVKYILSKDPLDFAWCTLETQIGSVYVYRNVLAGSFATARQHIISESEADALETAAERRALLASSIIVPDDVADELEGTLGGAPTVPARESTFYEVSNGHLEGTIAIEADSVLCLPIPATGTWHISVDGAEVETFTANYGFIGFALPQGTHEITATYELAGFKTGAIMSGAGVVLAGIGCAVIALNCKRGHEEQA